jgi:hypothetical protein
MVSDKTIESSFENISYTELHGGNTELHGEIKEVALRVISV